MNEFKNLFLKLTLSKVLKGLLCIIFSFYMTTYLSRYLSNTIWSSLFVFGCFCVVYRILLRFAHRLCKFVPKPKTVLCAMVIAILILFMFRNVFFPSTQEIFVTLISETAGEICLCNVIVDGKEIPVAEVEVVGNSGWLYREKYDNFMIWPEEDGVENSLEMRFFAKEVHLGFPLTPYAGSVTIMSSNGYDDTRNLRCSEQLWGREREVEYADFIVNCQYIYSPLEILLYSAGILPIISVFCLQFFYVVGQVCQKNRASEGYLLFQKNRKYEVKWFVGQVFFLSILLLIHYILFFSSSQIEPDKFTTGFLGVFVVALYICLSSRKAHCLLKKYRTTGKRVMVVIIALYASLSSFGHRFFLDGNTRIHFSMEGLIYLLLGMIWFIPVIYLLLFGLECLVTYRRFRTFSDDHRRAFWSLLIILCFGQAIILFSFWPGGFATDSMDLLKQAVGGSGCITSWHPPLNAILYRIILAICPKAGILVAVQLFFFAFLCTNLLMLGYDYGIHFKVLIFIGLVFGLLPSQVVSGVCPVKDYPYMLALMWMTYLLVRLFLNPEELQRGRFLLALTVSLFLIYGFRYNGIVPFIALLLLFMWVTIRYFCRVKFRLMLISLSSVLMIVVYQGPIFSLLRISQDVTMSPYTTMFCAVASCINKDLPLSEESNAIMESVLPLDQWATYYNRYFGHDLYYWGRGDLADEYPFDPAKITAKEAFKVYLEALHKYPDVVIKDRLDGMNLLWNVGQPLDSFNIKGFLDVTLLEEDHLEAYFDFDKMEYGVPYYNHSILANAYRSMLNTTTNNVFDMLFWRTGAYLILLMILGLFCWGNQVKNIICVAVPLLGEIVGLVFVLYHQSFRYVHAVQVLTLVLVFCSIFLHNIEDNPWNC